MTRLPKRYFKSISDYVRTYYTAYGAQRAQKLYDAVKTVTKDFTRTDPVYVRIGDDGEPEIHYTFANETSGARIFALQFPANTSLYIHNGDRLTSMQGMAFGSNLAKIVIDKIGAVNCEGIVQSSFYLKEFAVTGESKAQTLDYAFSNCYALKSALGIDCSAITLSYGLDGMFINCGKLSRFNGTGMKNGFDISPTAMEHDAILEVFNNLGEVDKTAGITLTLGSDKLALMSDEEKAIATGKGWVLA